MKINKLKINRVECNSIDKEITVIGEVYKGVLSFQTKIELPLYWFNVLLNHLQKKNSMIRIYDYIDTVYFPKGEILYELNTEGLTNKEINWDVFTGLIDFRKKIGA